MPMVDVLSGSTRAASITSLDVRGAGAASGGAGAALGATGAAPAASSAPSSCPISPTAPAPDAWPAPVSVASWILPPTGSNCSPATVVIVTSEHQPPERRLVSRGILSRETVKSPLGFENGWEAPKEVPTVGPTLPCGSERSRDVSIDRIGRALPPGLRFVFDSHLGRFQHPIWTSDSVTARVAWLVSRTFPVRFGDDVECSEEPRTRISVLFPQSPIWPRSRVFLKKIHELITVSFPQSPIFGQTIVEEGPWTRISVSFPQSPRLGKRWRVSSVVTSPNCLQENVLGRYQSELYAGECPRSFSVRFGHDGGGFRSFPFSVRFRDGGECSEEPRTAHVV